MFTFPSLEWFRELARLMNENEAEFKRLGYADVVWAMAIQPSAPDQPSHCFRFVFEEYGCTSVEELDEGDTGEVAFTMQATYDTWKDMIRTSRPTTVRTCTIH